MILCIEFARRHYKRIPPLLKKTQKNLLNQSVYWDGFKETHNISLDNPLFKESLRDSIETRQLSAVTFKQNYLYLQFDAVFLIIHTSPAIFDGNESLKWEEPGFRDKICGFITKIVKRTDIFEHEILIEFEDFSTILIPVTEFGFGEAVRFVYYHGNNHHRWSLPKTGLNLWKMTKL